MPEVTLNNGDPSAQTAPSRIWFSYRKEGKIMNTILIIVVLVLLLGGGGYYRRGRRG
jgi:hypothetical protein